MDMSKDPLFRGEFEVILELLAALKDGEASKMQCDKVIDKNGPKKCGGTGIKQLRENIAESKLSYEIMDDAAQNFLKTKIMDNIHKYFYLICFTAYTREAAQIAMDAPSDDPSLTGGKRATPADKLKLPKTFVQFMEEHSNLRTLVDEGKGNLGKIIHDIYAAANGIFRDLPQGDHKKRAKYRFASKTLMSVLPPAIKTEVEGLIAKKEITLDLYEILGQCTWGQSKLAA